MYISHNKAFYLIGINREQQKLLVSAIAKADFGSDIRRAYDPEIGSELSLQAEQM